MSEPRPGRTIRLGIRGKIAAVILICMVPVLALGVFFSYQRYQERRAFVLRMQQDTALALGASVEAFMTNAVHAERAAGAAVTSQPYPVSGIEALFAAIRANDPSFRSLALVLPDGRVEAANPPPPDRSRMSVAGSPAFEAVRHGARWAVGRPFSIDGRAVVEVTTSLTDAHGRVTAVVDGLVDLDRLRAALPRTFGRGADAILVDAGGRIALDVNRSGRPADAFQHMASVRAALDGESVPIDGYLDPGTRARELGAAVPIPQLGWAAIVLSPQSTVLQPVRVAATHELLWTAAYVGLGLVLAWVLGGELSAPILRLARGAQAIGRGELGARVALRRSDELGELGAAFDEMSAQLERYVSEMNALQSVSDAALSTVHLRELLPTLVRRIVAALRANAGTIWFIDEATGDLVVPQEFGGGPEDQARRLSSRALAERAATSGRVLVLSDPRSLGALAPDLVARGFRAGIGVPLRVGGKVIGVVQVLSMGPQAFGSREVRLLETFADRVALAVDNARAYERQQEIAGIIQRAIAPPPRVRRTGLEVAGRYYPSREVGGDFYAVLPLVDGRTGIAIADVSGKGIPAAALSVRCRYLLEAFALDGRPPDAVLARLNAVLADEAGGGTFVSLVYGVLDPASGVFAFSNAGHPPPLVLRAERGAPVILGDHGLLLGVVPEVRYHSAEVRLGPGDIIVLFTDGIAEARSTGREEFGERRLAALVGGLPGARADEIADRIAAGVAEWSGRDPADDQTFVVVRILPD